MKQRICRLGAVFIMMTMMVGCAVPSMKHVQAIDSSEKTVKFLYNQHVGEGYQRGMIECDLEGDELKNCRELEVQYRD